MVCLDCASLLQALCRRLKPSKRKLELIETSNQGKPYASIALRQILLSFSWCPGEVRERLQQEIEGGKIRLSSRAFQAAKLLGWENMGSRTRCNCVRPTCAPLRSASFCKLAVRMTKIGRHLQKLSEQVRAVERTQPASCPLPGSAIRFVTASYGACLDNALRTVWFLRPA